MNVFILSAGRSGSRMSARACAHLSNCTNARLARIGGKACRIARGLPAFLRNA